LWVGGGGGGGMPPLCGPGGGPGGRLADGFGISPSATFSTPVSARSATSAVVLMTAFAPAADVPTICPVVPIKRAVIFFMIGPKMPAASSVPLPKIEKILIPNIAKINITIAHPFHVMDEMYVPNDALLFVEMPVFAASSGK
jgi:hypothetical protein